MNTLILTWSRVESLVPVQSMNQVRQDLCAYGTHHGLSGLESRLSTGLDPIGMVAVRETRQRLDRIASSLGASMGKVAEMTHRLFRGQPVRNERLCPDHEPHGLVWMIAACAAGEHQGLDPIGFLQDYWRLNRELETAAVYPQLAAERALATLLRNLRSHDNGPIGDFKT
ncbi:MAG TPA: hypothetical protein VFX30_03640 [bacterium]|nr:hypothetical protein [bacterium]